MGNLEAVLNQLEKRVADAFRKAMSDIKSGITVQSLERLVAQRDTAGIMDMLDLSPAYFSDLDRAIDVAYYEGATREGNLINEQLPAAVFRFDGRHRRAELWTREHGGQLVQTFSNEIKANIRAHVEQSLADGRGPRETALDILGRKEGGARERTGGIIGLTAQQVEYVTNMRKELEGTRDPSGYFTRAARDKRFDKMVEAAQNAGKTLPPAAIERIVGRYSDKLLALRALTISRTEALTALNAGRYEATAQLIDSGKVPRSAVTLIWDATISKRTRDTHLMLNGKEVHFGGLFETVKGNLLRFPGDTGVGAPGSETINCRCTLRTRIDRKQLATKKPRGRPPGTLNKPKPPVTPPTPPVTRPEAPVVPVAVPQPVPAQPTFTYRSPESFTSFAELDAYADAAGIATVTAFPSVKTPSWLTEKARVILRAQEMTERFGLAPLTSYREPNLKDPIERKLNKKAGGWCYMSGPNDMAIVTHMMDPGKVERRHKNAIAWDEHSRESHREKHMRRVSAEIKPILAEAPFEKLAGAMLPNVTPVDLIVVHEYGHRVHRLNKELIDKAIDAVNWRHWSFVVSEYSQQNALEVVAECFVLYIEGGPAEHRRIPPPLLAAFRSIDKKWKTQNPS